MTDRGYEIVRCVACRTAYVTPMPGGDEVEAVYAADYFAGDTYGGYEDYDAETEGVLPLFEDFLDRSAGSSLLDLGSAYGTHLAIAADRGWRVAGVEISDHARRVAAERLGAGAAVLTTIAEATGGPFDVISMLDFIEHVPDPYLVFYELAAVGAIGPETTVLITTPNGVCREAQLGAEWRNLHPPIHLVYFSPVGLATLLKAVGAGVVSVRGEYPLPFHIGPIEPEEDATAGLAALVAEASGFEVPAAASSFEAWCSGLDVAVTPGSPDDVFAREVAGRRQALAQLAHVREAWERAVEGRRVASERRKELAELLAAERARRS